MSGADKLKQLFGLDANELESHELETPDYPKTVPGRVLHIDGDFLAYQVAADDEKPIADMMHNHDVAVETLRLLAGAEMVVSHLTASHGDKGGRYDQAIQKEYQANRKGKVKPKYLWAIKSWMEQARGAISHESQEADDGLCQANWNAVQDGRPDLSVLVSRDKDLQMCAGYHLDWEYGQLEFVEGFGYVDLDRSKSSPKIVGKGHKYFWAQMLTGDTADDIQGLPKLSGTTLNAIKPTKAVDTALNTLRSSVSSPEQKKRAQKVLDDRKPGACGPVIAAELLKRLNNNRQAFALIKGLYEKHGQTEGFKHWKTGEDVPWQKVFLSEAQLLWMRRKPDPNDVIHFFREECQ